MVPTYTDMFSVYVIVLLCLVSVSHSAPLACEDLVRPLDQLHFHHLEGRWALVAGGLSNSSHLESFKRRDSASIEFVNETSTISFNRVFKFGDSCYYKNTNITLEGSSFIFNQSNIIVTVLHTSCSDCLVMRFDNNAKELLRVYLFSRRRALEQKEMEEFNAQVVCLNMLPPVVMDPNKELCAEQTPINAAAQVKEKTDGQ